MEEKYKIHAVYILGILLTIIVVLITVRWGENPKLAEYFNFGLTFASMVLAILAIAYAVYSNASLSQNLTALDNASRDVSDTAKTISDAAKDLSQKIEAIPTRLESVETRIAETNILVRQFSEASNTPPPTPDEKKAISEIAELFINRANTGGQMAMYLCIAAYTTKKPFDTKEMLSEFNFFTFRFAIGVLTTMQTVGLISTKRNGLIWSVVDINEKMREVTRSMVEEKINSSFREKVTESTRSTIFNELIKIDNYFEL